MNNMIAQLLAIAFLVGTLGLLALVVAITRGQFKDLAQGASLPFASGERGWTEDPVAGPRLQTVVGAGGEPPDPEELATRQAADRSTHVPVVAFMYSAVFWLVVGSVFGLLTSLKFHWPDMMSGSAAGTFGRLRPLHLNTVAYGWLSMAGMGVAIWLLPRLLKTPLRGANWATAGAVV